MGRDSTNSAGRTWPQPNMKSCQTKIPSSGHQGDAESDRSEMNGRLSPTVTEQLTVADVIERVCFVDPPTPDTNHVLVPIHEELQPLAVAFWRDPTQTRAISKSAIESKTPECDK